MIDFAVLGPLAVRRDGVPVVLAAPMVRHLLAVLLCRPGQPVPVADLIEALWGHDQPATARKTLQVYVHRLRQALGDESRIVHGSASYCLIVKRDELDAHRFADLAGQGQAARRRGRLEEASELLRQALDLWQGPPYADAGPSTIMAEEARRLEEQRLLAYEERIVADLDLGRHAQVVAELTALAEANPYREDLHALLMLTLHRAGRTAEALEVFRAARATLTEELGIEPGTLLQRLHQAVLRDDTRLDRIGADRLADDLVRPPTAQVRTPAPAQPLPRELPGDIAGFAGRAAQLDALDGMLPRQLPPAAAALVGRARELAHLRRAVEVPRDPGRPAVLAIHGPAGVGKSALSLRLAHDLAEQFPDGQLYLDLQGASPGLAPLTPGAALARLLQGLGSPPAQVVGGLANVAAFFRSATAGRRLLILLDNAIDARQVGPILPASAGCLVVVTSRVMLASLDATEHVLVAPLSTDESVRVLAYVAGAKRVAAEPAAAVDIARLCENLPLALRIVGARLAAHHDLTLGHLADRLADERNRLDLLELPELNLRASLRVSYDQLGSSDAIGDKRAARAFRLLAALGLPSFGIDAVAALLDMPRAHAEAATERLSELSLLEPAGQNRMRMHDLLRMIGAELAADDESTDELRAAVGRVVDYYVASAWRACTILRPKALPPSPRAEVPYVEDLADTPAAMTWLERELPNLLVIARRDDADSAVDLLRGLNPYLPALGHWDSLAELADAALKAATAAGDRRGRSLALAALGLARHRQGDIDAALSYVGSALELRQQTGDLAAEGAALDLLGLLYHETGQHAAAIACWARAFRLHRQTGRTLLMATSLHNLGEAYAALGRLDAAERFARRSLPLRVEAADPYGEARTSVALGRIRAARGDLRDARRWLGQGIAQAQTVRYAEVEWEGHIYLAEVAVREGQTTEALDALRSAGRLAEKVGRPYLRWVVLRQLSEVHLQLGDRDTARSSATEAQEILMVASSGRDPALEAFLGYLKGDDRGTRTADLTQRLTRLRPLPQLTLLRRRQPRPPQLRDAPPSTQDNT